jgi:hypothetical protein
MKAAPPILMVLGGLLLLFAPSLPTSPVVVPAETPPAALVAIVQPITAATFTSDDSAAVAEFCRVFADVVEKDATAKLIPDTAALRDRLAEASKLMFQQTGIDQRHPSVPGQINSVLAKAMAVEGEDGVQVVPLDEADRRAKAVAAFKAIAWAAEN